MMIILFHGDYERHPMMMRDIRMPMTDAMVTLSRSLLSKECREEVAHTSEAEVSETASTLEQFDALGTAERVRLATALFEAGGYLQVAVIAGSDMDFAYKATQNGVLSDSWSREPPVGVKPCEPSYHLHNGRRFGRKSTDIGDLMLVDGEMFVVDTCGFTPVPLSNTAPA